MVLGSKLRHMPQTDDDRWVRPSMRRGHPMADRPRWCSRRTHEASAFSCRCCFPQLADAQPAPPLM